MKINDSICADCKHFEHECYVPMGEDDYGCTEYCTHKDADIKERFHNEFEIVECKGFERE